ncbi:MFS transporter [Marinobacterium sediminicola]|uniref:Drug resistance transporter, EmrB/QacA subfamily n=1 Tax=Marinobacterium sediminicola TaxID=518898 RepID=A0ABY1RYW3_9GAMM|nr:MFS transporter [Marinobacterium sediminicola]ULG68029.1 MFS transporter [Marinobacterium sediminicola]SMR73461.1 drug resistance transporter, EmrB/QacA subfamily [Marinobacterium sediminicola]
MTTADPNDVYSSASTRWLALISICVATFLMPMSMSAVNVALPAIAADLRADAVLVSWIPTMNLLGAIALQLPAGRIADMIGRKKVFLCGLLLFALSSLVVIWVSHIGWLLLMRLLQGIGGAMVFGTGMAIVSQVFAQHGRGMALGLTSTSVYLGLTCGPPIGGWLTEWWNWHAVFVAPLPLTVLCAVLVAIHVRETQRQHDQKLDWVGSLLFIVASSLLFVGLSELPGLMGGLLALTGLLLLAGFIYQQEHCPYPLIRPRRMVQNLTFFRSIQASFLMYAANYPLQFLLSLYLQYIRGLSPAEAGQLMLLQAMMMAILAPLAGRLSDRMEPRIPATLGCVLFAIGFLILALLDQQSGLTQVVIALLVMGTGFGLFSSPNNNGALSVVPHDKLSIASSLLNISRTLGNMLGMAVVVFLFNLLIGNAQLVPEQFPALMRLLEIAFILCSGYALIAAWRSWSRGKVRSS